MPSRDESHAEWSGITENGCWPLLFLAMELTTTGAFPGVTPGGTSTTGNSQPKAGSSGTRQPPALPPAAAALERLPHLVGKVSLLWGEREFETFVNRLVMDSRNGKRQGLPWEAAQELLFLAELSVAKRALVAAEVTGVPFSKMFAQCLATAASESTSGGADHWSDPSAHRDVGHFGRDRQRPKASPAGASRPAKKKSWWRSLFG
jgi:hypothetical protein